MVAWAWVAAAAAVVLIVWRVRRERFAQEPGVWYLPAPPGFASLLRSVVLARQRAPVSVVTSPAAIAECWRDCVDWYRRRSRRDWIVALVESLIECTAVALCAAAAIQGRVLAEYALITVVAFQMLEGYVRASAAKEALPEHAAWFKRHAWVHAWWAPLAGWVRLVCVVASAAGRVN
jgi:hypothetical protein